MAKGVISFEFDSLRDLEKQLRAALGLGGLVEVPLGEVEHRAPCVYPELQPVPTKDLMKAAAQAFSSPCSMVGKTAVPLPELSEEAKAAPPAEVPPAAAQAAPLPVAPSTAGPAVPPPPEQNAPTLTLETLAAAPYPELLAFCACNPEVGVNPEKCGPTFFRPLVESKIKTYLETK